MKKTCWCVACLCGFVFASDAITIDSIFKKQVGIRSITTLSLLTTGNANSYRIYPDLLVEGDQTLWNNTYSFSLNQTLMYTITPKLDIFANVGGSFSRQEFENILSSTYRHSNHAKFDSLWFGFVYSLPRMYDFIPQATFQTAIMQRERANENLQTFYLKSQSLQLSLRSYSDPLVYSLYIGANYNAERKFRHTGRVNYGQSFYGGVNFSIILSPKITLDAYSEQRFQTPQRVNGVRGSGLRSFTTIGGGTTYSFNADTALSFSVATGSSSASPDSIITLSLWKRF